jgi:hypothetical protein
MGQMTYIQALEGVTKIIISQVLIIRGLMKVGGGLDLDPDTEAAKLLKDPELRCLLAAAIGAPVSQQEPSELDEP